MNIIFFGLLAGLHAACYGAYKDAPHENFRIKRFFREIIIGGVLGITAAISGVLRGETSVVIFLVLLAGCRIVTEFYKLFIRVEPQDEYLIPTQVHVLRHVVQNRFARLLWGLVFIGFIALALYVSLNLPSDWNTVLQGVAIGFVVGLITALGGGYKDGLFEGFEKLKFFRSPVVGMVGGLFLSYQTKNPAFLALGAIGFERMFVELYKGFFKKGYAHFFCCLGKSRCQAVRRNLPVLRSPKTSQRRAV